MLYVLQSVHLIIQHFIKWVPGNNINCGLTLALVHFQKDYKLDEDLKGTEIFYKFWRGKRDKEKIFTDMFRIFLKTFQMKELKKLEHTIIIWTAGSHLHKKSNTWTQQL